MNISTRVAVAGALAVIALSAWTGPAQAQVIERVSVAGDELQADGGSAVSSLSAAGRYVVFTSMATNLVPGDTNGSDDVFVRDRRAGTTERVSVASDGTQGNGSSYAGPCAISGDGRYVVFQSVASNLAPGDTNGACDVFFHDRQTGKTTRVSLSSTGEQAAGPVDSASGGASLSADGRHVAFLSFAANLVTGETTSGKGEVFVRDLETGVNVLASVGADGSPADGPTWECLLSGDGRHVVFQSSATNLVAEDTNGEDDIFVCDLDDGTTERVSVSSGGLEANGPSWYGACISANGRFVAFSCEGSNLVTGDTNRRLDVFVRDRDAKTTERASVSSTGVQGNLASGARSISADGRYVAMLSYATNLARGDTNRYEDVFVRDLQSGTTQRVNLGPGGTQANAPTPMGAVLSADGRLVAFASMATNLVEADTNNQDDVFAEDVFVAALNPAPMITGLEPAEGPMRGGNPVVISGDNLTGLTGPSAVTFGGVAASSYAMDSTMQVTAVAPAHAPETVRVEVTTVWGASSDTLADDYAFVDPALIPTRHEETDQNLAYAGTWYRDDNARCSAGSQRCSWGWNASVTVVFTGISLDWIGSTGPLMGDAWVTVDGGPLETVDLYSPSPVAERKVWSTGPLADGRHVVKITHAVSANPLSFFTPIGLDAVDVVGTLVAPASL